jgi:hypothetical protein
MHRSEGCRWSGELVCTGVSGPPTRRTPIGHNGAVTSGKRAAPKHSGHARLDASGIPPLTPGRAHGGTARQPNGPLLLLALGITAAVVAWGYLVYLAIDFGTTARNGDGRAWWFLAMATVGAIACLFFGLMLGMRLLARIREGAPPPGPPVPPRPPGGRRAAR